MTDAAPTGTARVDDTDPCARRTLRCPDGAQLVMCAHGGQLLGWTPASGGPDRLWTSPLARCGPGTAIRGGVPVVFPQFSDRGPLPKHGLVRDRAWRLDAAPAGFVARTADDPGTRAAWQQGFGLTLTVTAVADRLELALDVENTGPDGWSFTAALHAYLATSDAGRATVEGLGGLPGEDNAAGGTATVLPGGPLTAVGPRDVAVRGSTAAPIGSVHLDDPALGRLVVDAEGFTDRVLWNPGAAHGLGDVPPGGETGFVCVEPAVLTPVRLAPGQGWRGVLRLAAGPAGRPAGPPAG